MTLLLPVCFDDLGNARDRERLGQRELCLGQIFVVQFCRLKAELLEAGQTARDDCTVLHVDHKIGFVIPEQRKIDALNGVLD